MHYSASLVIRVGIRKATSADINPEFWPVVVETFSGRKLKKGEADRGERRVLDDTGWRKRPAS